MRQAINVLLIVDIGIVIFCLLSGQKTWLINTQIGFITSTFVMFGSILSYRSMVQGRLNAGAIPDDNRDTIEKLEDPYDLYSEEQKEDENKTLKEVIKEERENLKKNRRSVWQATKDSKASLSFYRLVAYGLLIMGFFYLNSNNLLDIPSYLFSLIVPPVIIVIILMRNK